MAGKINKRRIKGYDYWYFGIFDTNKKPKQKYFYFQASKYRKRDVQEIRDRYELAFQKGWDPWETDKPPDDLEEKSYADLNLESAVVEYKASAQPNLAKSTYQVYSDYLLDLVRYLNNGSLETVARDDYQQWVNRDGTYNTRRSRAVIVQQLANYLTKTYDYPTMKFEAHGTKAEKAAKKYIELSEEQKNLLLQGVDERLARQPARADNPSVKLGAIKDKDIINVLFYMGLRYAELLHCRPAWVIGDVDLLRIGDLNSWGLPEGEHFTPKSGQEHDMPIAIPSEVKEIFRRRIAACSSKYDRLFKTRAPKWVRERIKEVARNKLPDLADGISPHAFRVSCCSYWLNEREKPIQEVQRLLRHANISTTMHYHRPSTDAHLKAFLS